uniref:MedDCM-OCT-S23-C8-cds2 n=1 Tax=Candidatus Actinomarina minuta TaxID=1389454 RepID=S5DP73_9ACTN|nr:MedDCM-OCT-S23-C8-cds2 [Candidatus Actinomarina minuta]
MNKQSPIYSFKFTISWIIVYSLIVLALIQLINIFIALYIGLWLLNLIIELTERLFLRFGKRLVTVEE